MKPAAENGNLDLIFDKKKIKFDIISNVNAKATCEPDEIKNLLIEQIYSTVRWREV